MREEKPSQQPLPVADPVTAPFWESVRAHAMRVQHCNACGRGIFYPRGICPLCFSTDLAWEIAAGTGVVQAFTIVHRHPNPAFNEAVPYVVALIELDEGVRMLSNVIGIEPDPAQVRVGLPVEVVYDDVSDEVTLPKFKPRSA